MNSRINVGFAVLTVMSLSAFTVSCDKSADHAIPKRICGTPVDPDITRPLVTSTDEFHEFNRVDRATAITAPCVLLSGKESVLDFRFSWDEKAPDLMYLAKDTGSVSGVADPRSIDFTYKTLVGTDGAISTAPCKTKGGEHFTLTLQLPQIKLLDGSHRKDIDKFMRAYFPAAVKTLNCA